MEQAKALLIKFAGITAALYLALSFGGAASTAAQLLTVALVLTVVAYIVGDRMILPAGGNAVAVVADGLVAMAILWLCGALMPGLDLPFGAIVLATLLIAVVEFFFHRYLIARGLVEPPGSDRLHDRNEA